MEILRKAEEIQKKQTKIREIKRVQSVNQSLSNYYQNRIEEMRQEIEDRQKEIEKCNQKIVELTNIQEIDTICKHEFVPFCSDRTHHISCQLCHKIYYNHSKEMRFFYKVLLQTKSKEKAKVAHLIDEFEDLKIQAEIPYTSIQESIKEECDIDIFLYGKVINKCVSR